MPIVRTAKTALDANLVNGQTSDAPKIKANNDTLYDFVDGLEAADGDHANNPTLAHPDGSVTGPKIRNGAVGTDKLAPLAVTSDKIAAGAVGPSQLQTGLAATVDTNAQFAKRGIDVTSAPYNAKGDGVTDDTAAINAALIAANGNTVYFPKGVYLVSSERYRTGDISKDEGCILVPSNTSIYFQPGTVLRVIDNAQQWTRILKIMNASNVNIFGNFEIDGRCSTVTSGNEHMHGLFISQSKNVFIESLYSHDCYGDNIFIGGTEALPSENININSVRCKTAGRKNLVIHYVDKLHIGTAILDNSLGGAGTWTGSNSLDLEPDVFTGSRTFHQRIDYISTYGSGNDFTVGTTEDLARKWTIDVGTFLCRRMASGLTSEVMLIYGVTLRINKLLIEIPTNEIAYGMHIQYAANVRVEDAVIVGGANFGVRATLTGSNAPRVSFDKLKIFSTEGSGVTCLGAFLDIGFYLADSLKGVVFESSATGTFVANIAHVETRNCSSNTYLFSTSVTASNVPYVNIGDITVFDSQTVKATSVMRIWSNGAAAGLSIGSINNPNSIPVISSGGGVTQKYYRLRGGSAVHPAMFVVIGTPEGFITAPIGSVALRTDGGAGTCWYVKESGTGNTGWVAK